MNTPEKRERKRLWAIFERLKSPEFRLLRIPAGIVLIACGLVGFLPLVGFWMLPLGLAILAVDFPMADRLLQKLKVSAARLRLWFRRNGG